MTEEKSAAMQEAVQAHRELSACADNYGEWQKLRAEAVTEAIDRGVSLTDVALALGVTVPSVRMIYDRAKAHRQMSDEAASEALAAMRELGVEFLDAQRSYQAAIEERKAAIVAAVEEGVSFATLATYLGVSAQNVGMIYNRHKRKEDNDKPQYGLEQYAVLP